MDPIAYFSANRRSSCPSDTKELERCRNVLALAEDELSTTEETYSSSTELDESVSDWGSFDIDDILNSFTATSAPPSRRRSDGMILKRDLPQKLPSNIKGESRRVSFGHIEIRTCERILGDNIPSGSSVGLGPSLGLGWGYNNEKPLPVEKYEAMRSSQRRFSNNLLLSPEKREKLAKKAGFTRKDIEENVRIISKTQRRRNRTAKEVEKEEMAEFIQLSRQKCLSRFLQTQTQTGHSTSTSNHAVVSPSVRSF